MRRALTAKQAETLVSLARLSRNDTPPTIRELAQDAGVGFDTMRQRLIALQRKGFVRSERYRNRARALTPLGLSHPGVQALAAAWPQSVATGRLGYRMRLVWARDAA